MDKSILKRPKKTSSKVTSFLAASINWNSRKQAAGTTWYPCSIWWFSFLKRLKCQDITMATRCPNLRIRTSSLNSSSNWGDTRSPRISVSETPRVYTPLKRRCFRTGFSSVLITSIWKLSFYFSWKSQNFQSSDLRKELFLKIKNIKSQKNTLNKLQKSIHVPRNQWKALPNYGRIERV